MSKLVQVVMLLAYVWEVSSLNIGCDTDSFDFSLWFSSVLLGRYCCNTLS
jgi:hypothetical protein